MRALLWLLLPVFWCALVRAEPGAEVRAEIVPPPLDGRVSLGVFDAAGKCVRVLWKNSEQEKIPAALNGWALSWDGKLEDGETAAPGLYELRGVVIGQVKISGLAWHFNDWIDPDHAENAPRRTLQAALLPNGGFVLVQRGFNGVFRLTRCLDNGQVVWSQPLSLEPKFLTTLDDRAVVASAAKLQTFSLENGALAGESVQKISSLAGRGAALFFTRERELFSARSDQLNEVQPVGSFPSPIITMAATENGIFASDGQKLFQQKDSQIAEIPLPAGEAISQLAGAAGESCWTIVQAAGGPSLKCFGVNGMLIRELPAEDHFVPVQASVSADQNSILEISAGERTERVRLLQKVAGEAQQASGQDVSFWKPILQREIVQAENFGLDAGGKLVPNGSIEQRTTVEVALVENPLQPGAAQSLKLRGKLTEDGVWICTQSGLPLFPITRGVPSNRIALVDSSKSNSARLYLGFGAAVAEYQINGLANIMTCTSGPLQWPPGPALQPDEDHVPAANPE